MCVYAGQGSRGEDARAGEEGRARRGREDTRGRLGHHALVKLAGTPETRRGNRAGSTPDGSFVRARSRSRLRRGRAFRGRCLRIVDSVGRRRERLLCGSAHKAERSRAHLSVIVCCGMARRKERCAYEIVKVAGGRAL